MSPEKQCLRRLAISTKNGNNFWVLLLLSSVSGSSERSNQYKLGLRKRHVLWVTLLMQCFKVWGNPGRQICSWSQWWIYRLVLGQGAALAFEDAIVLKTLLPFGTPKSEIPEILKRYELIRKLRVHSIQNLCTEQMLSSIRSQPFMKCESDNPSIFNFVSWHYVSDPTIALELQLPVMGYDVAAEMSRYRLFSDLRDNNLRKIGHGVPLLNKPKARLWK